MKNRKKTTKNDDAFNWNNKTFTFDTYYLECGYQIMV